MSRPCGNYNNNSLKVLKKIGIKIGFRSNLIIKKIKSNLEVPREDHANLLKRLKWKSLFLQVIVYGIIV